jgi:two-component system response regulator FixJ
MSGGEEVYIVGNDLASTASMGRLFDSVHLEPRIFHSPVEFLDSFRPNRPCCLLLEMRMPKLTGLEVLLRLKQQGSRVPVIMVTAYAEVTSAVRAMKLGAVEFLEKPVNEEQLLEYVQYWIGVNHTETEDIKRRTAMEEKLASLSPREREVLQGVLNSLSNKEIARELGVSPKAIELYRANLMTKMAAPSLVALVRETLCCSLNLRCPCHGRIDLAEPRNRQIAQEPQADVSKIRNNFNKI